MGSYNEIWEIFAKKRKKTQERKKIRKNHEIGRRQVTKGIKERERGRNIKLEQERGREEKR